MFQWIMTDFFLKRQDPLLPASTQQAHSKQTSTDKFLLHTSEEDTSRTTGLIQHGHARRPGVTTKVEGVTLNLDQRGSIPWVKATEACYSRGEPSSGAECTSSGMSSSSSSSLSGFPFSWGCAAASAVIVGCSVTTGAASGVSIVPPHPTRGVPSRTCASPMTGTGVPLLVHSYMRWSWILLRLSWATASLLMVVAVLASA
jgi:hypothetical protein